MFRLEFTIDKLERLSVKQRQILITIISYWDDKTKASEFTLVKLAEEYSLTPESMRLHVKKLIKEELLRKTPARSTYELPFMTKDGLEAQLIREQLEYESWKQKRQQ